MKSDKNAGRRSAMGMLRPVDKSILAVLALMVLALVVLSILQRAGLSLINGTVMLYLPFMALFVLLGWGSYALVRHIRARVAKVAVCSVLVLILMLAMVWVFTNVASLAFFVTPKRYATITSPSGERRLVVLRVFDTDEERVESRKAARLEAYPDSPDELRADDMCQLYTAFPQVMGIFYRNNVDVEGELRLAYTDLIAQSPGDGESNLEIGFLPHGTLMVEWQDDESVAHFYVENAGVGEGGDFYVRF